MTCAPTSELPCHNSQMSTSLGSLTFSPDYDAGLGNLLYWWLPACRIKSELFSGTTERFGISLLQARLWMLRCLELQSRALQHPICHPLYHWTAVSSISKVLIHLANSYSQLKTQMKSTLFCEMLPVWVPTTASRSFSYLIGHSTPTPTQHVSCSIQKLCPMFFMTSAWELQSIYHIFAQTIASNMQDSI